MLAEQFAELGLGLERNKLVRLAPYDERWPLAFSKAQALIQSALAIPGLRVHHMGSTSVPGLSAKPILDLLLELPTLELLDQRQLALESLGFAYKGEYGISGRRYCVLYSQDASIGYLHLHGFASGHAEIGTHLLFRDFLRAHPGEAARYEKKKVELAASAARSEYTELKAPLIQELLQLARDWKKKEAEIFSNPG